MKKLFYHALLPGIFCLLFCSCFPKYKMWQQGAVTGITHGYRPKPDVYLRPHYIHKCLSKFDNGGSYLVPVAVLDKYGRNLLGRTDGQFIMAKAQMDDLLQQANGNVSFIEHELGIS